MSRRKLNVLKKKSKRYQRPFSKISNRITILFFVVVLLFSVLVLRLAQMQLFDSDFYVNKLKESTTYTIKSANERGQIYDAQGVALVENTSKDILTFTRDNTVKTEIIKEEAQKLATIVQISDTSVSLRDRKDYYLADQAVYAAVVKELPDDKKYDKFKNSLTESTIYANAVNAVTEDQVRYSDEELKAVALFTQMNAASVFTTVNLQTDDLTEEQEKIIGEQLDQLPGIAISTGWERKPITTALSSIIGLVSTEKSGLPQEDAEELLANGYSLNDRVGTSYIEKYYESYLQGSRTVRQVTVDRKGEVISDAITEEGAKGKNIKLTIDLKFQEGVQNILNSYFSRELDEGTVNYSEGVYAVALDPSSGAIRAMAGLSHETGTKNLTEDSLGTITQVFTPGSVVKGATLAAGWENGVLTGNETLLDQSIQFAGSAPIKSWFTSGSMPITAAQALEYSSNTYMVQLVMRLMGQPYEYGMYLSEDGYKEAMEKLRSTYAEFGLGTSTGIDLPTESKGYIPEDYTVSNVLTESFGQFDNYTPMQLAQYAATIANGGNRLAVHLAEGIYDANESGGLGQEIQAINTKTLNTVGISSEDMGIIQQGFYNVVNSGSGYATGSTIAQNSAVTIAAKTGTAETFATDASGNSVTTSNVSVVAYDVNDSGSKIAVGIILPHTTELTSTVAHEITRDIINLYYSMYMNTEQSQEIDVDTVTEEGE
ncbi:penicillin-binding protein PBP2B [Streptococcus caprae]|uniref:Penicillin-binding protein PBP2B n=1 Tax=Streptococcus caprae TaxID=1640501 RepID=A0ABV8CTM9_9STRE